MAPYRLYIFDLDGTLYRGDQPIDGAVESVLALAHQGAQIRYLTNNSGQTRQFFLDKLQRMGFPAQLHEIYSTATGTAAHLNSHNLRRPFIVGEYGLGATLAEAGLNPANLDLEGRPSAQGEVSDSVVVGICRHFTYDLMNEAMQRIRSGQPFIATNPDTTYPMEGSRLIPGAGSIVAAVQACSGTTPYIVGKPNPYLVELVLSDANIPPEYALVVGDRIDTDLLCGERAGCPTHLVLTGVTLEAPLGQSWSYDLRGLI